MKNYTILFALALFIQTNVYAQMRPCVNGRAGNYPCKDYDLMSNLTNREMAGRNATGNDVWGWTDPETGNEYAIMCQSTGAVFVNITDPIKPVIVGRLATATSSSNWRDVKVYKNHAYIVSEARDHGMQVFDLTKLRGITRPRTFDADARFTGAGACHNIAINEKEGVAYLVGCRSANGGGPIFVDVSNPNRPREVGEFRGQGYSHDAQIVSYNGPDRDYRGKEIYIGSNENEVVVVDITNKSNPKFISDIGYPQRGYTHQGWFTEDQRYFLLGDETDEQRNGFNTKTLVFDMVNLDRPRLIYTHFGETKAIDHNGYVKGNKFYLANYSAGMRVLDLSDVDKKLTEIGFFDSYPASNRASFNGTWSVYPYFASGNIIMSNKEGGLFVVRQSGTLSTDDVGLDGVFTLSPNPTTSVATIKASQNRLVESVEIFNTLGQNVFGKLEINKSVFNLPISNYAKGVYLVKINNKVTKKLILK